MFMSGNRLIFGDLTSYTECRHRESGQSWGTTTSHSSLSPTALTRRPGPLTEETVSAKPKYVLYCTHSNLYFRAGKHNIVYCVFIFNSSLKSCPLLLHLTKNKENNNNTLTGFLTLLLIMSDYFLVWESLSKRKPVASCGVGNQPKNMHFGDIWRRFGSCSFAEVVHAECVWLSFRYFMAT